MRMKARKLGFYYLGEMENALAGDHLQLCDPKNQGGYGINFVSPESVDGLPDERFNPVNWLHDIFHPNERGHQAMLDVFNQWLAGNDMTAGSASGPAASPRTRTRSLSPHCHPLPDASSAPRPTAAMPSSGPGSPRTSWICGRMRSPR